MHPDTTNSDFDSPDWIVFGGRPMPDPGGATNHGAFDAVRRLFARDIQDVRRDFDRVGAQLQQLATSFPATAGNYEVDEFTIDLGFSASGSLVFVAEAGLEATVSITFRRKDAGDPTTSDM
jgi:hypothetical protein